MLKQNANLKDFADALGMNPSNKGRNGRTIERLLGLSGTDNRTEADWHGVEVKGVAVKTGIPSRISPVIVHKIFVCSATQNPIAKLERVLFVFHHYQTNIILNVSSMSLTPELRQRLQEDVERATRKSGADLLFLGTKGSGHAWYLREDFFIRCGMWQ